MIDYTIEFIRDVGSPVKPNTGFIIGSIIFEELTTIVDNKEIEEPFSFSSKDKGFPKQKSPYASKSELIKFLINTISGISDDVVPKNFKNEAIKYIRDNDNFLWKKFVFNVGKYLRIINIELKQYEKELLEVKE